MSVDTDYKVLREVLKHHRPDYWAIEFGVYSGYSLKIIADYMPVIGLDSFEGLPEDWRLGFPKGRFKAPGALPYCPNAMIIPGLFEDTVPMLQKHGLMRFGLVHIDCDLYSSTVTALEGVLPFIGPGTYVVFDEFQGYDGHEEHEARAWYEFIRKHRIDASAVTRGVEEQAFRINSIGLGQ